MENPIVSFKHCGFCIEELNEASPFGKSAEENEEFFLKLTLEQQKKTIEVFKEMFPEDESFEESEFNFEKMTPEQHFQLMEKLPFGISPKDYQKILFGTDRNGDYVLWCVNHKKIMWSKYQPGEIIGNPIISYIHCNLCMEELPEGILPNDYQDIQFGTDVDGYYLLWCWRHEKTVSLKKSKG